MNITDLEETQGMTADMVRAYLEKSGWTMDKHDEVKVWRHPTSKEPINKIFDTFGITLPHAIEAIADCEGRSIQAVLRDVNPRLRKGKPSAEARRAHSSDGGVWIATHGTLGEDGSIVFASFDEGRIAFWDGDSWAYPDIELTDNLPEFSFWPCDSAGNKVPWPSLDGVSL